MSKVDYILRSLSKVRAKRWEHYVVNRVFHLLDDPDLEFVCQQAMRKDGKLYLADLYLPQLDMYLEIKEKYHDFEEQKLRDAQRRLDIEEATGFLEKEITVYDRSIESINTDIDDFVSLIREKKAEKISCGAFVSWDYDRKFDPRYHLEKGVLKVGPYAAFRFQRDALSCFGYGKGHYQRGVWTVPPESVSALGGEGAWMVWFPRLYEISNWKNELSADGCTITETSKIPGHRYLEPWDRRIVMARSRDSLNRTLYRFLGVFAVDPEYKDGPVHKFVRVSTEVPTVWPAGWKR